MAQGSHKEENLTKNVKNIIITSALNQLLLEPLISVNMTVFLAANKYFFGVGNIF
jgi:hypothetical protein